MSPDRFLQVLTRPRFLIQKVRFSARSGHDADRLRLDPARLERFDRRTRLLVVGEAAHDGHRRASVRSRHAGTVAYGAGSLDGHGSVAVRRANRLSVARAVA